MSFERAVTIRFPQGFRLGEVLQVKVDSQAECSALIKMLKDAKKDSTQQVARLFLLKRANAARRDGSVLDDSAIDPDRKLSTVSFQAGDTFDFTPNPELFAILTAIAREFEFAFERFAELNNHATCPKCGGPTETLTKAGIGKWQFCCKPECSFPALKMPQTQGNNKNHIEAYEIRVAVGDLQHSEQTEVIMPCLQSLAGAQLQTRSDADDFFDAAHRQMKAIRERRKFRLCPAIAYLVREYANELQQIVASGAEADPILAFCRRHKPDVSMPFAASQTKDSGGAGGGNGKSNGQQARKEGRVDAEKAWNDAVAQEQYTQVLRRGQTFRFNKSQLLEVTRSSDEPMMKWTLGAVTREAFDPPAGWPCPRLRARGSPVRSKSWPFESVAEDRGEGGVRGDRGLQLQPAASEATA